MLAKVVEMRAVLVNLALLTSALAVIACGSSKKDDKGKSATPPDRTRIPIKVTSEPPPGVAKGLWADIGWFPEDITVITEMTRKDRMLPMVDFVKGMARSSKWPPCALAHLDKVSHYFLAARSMTSTSTVVFFAETDRKQVDDCAAKVAAKPSLKGSATVKGPVTELRALGNKGYLGWVDVAGTKVTVFDTDPKRVDEFLGAAKRIGAKHPLANPLSRANRSADQWVVGAVDIGRQYFGIPSSSFALEMSYRGSIRSGKPVPLVVKGWIEFDADSRAAQALERLETVLKAIGDKLPLEVLHNLSRKQEGSRLRIDLKLDTKALATVMRWLAEAGKTMRGLDK